MLRSQVQTASARSRRSLLRGALEQPAIASARLLGFTVHVCTKLVSQHFEELCFPRLVIAPLRGVLPLACAGRKAHSMAGAHGAAAKAAATQPASRGAQHESGSERRAALTHSRTRQSKNKSVLYFRQPKLERSPTARRCRLQAGARERHMKGGRSRGLSGPPWPPGTGPSTSSFCASRLRASAAAAQCQRRGSL